MSKFSALVSLLKPVRYLRIASHFDQKRDALMDRPPEQFYMTPETARALLQFARFKNNALRAVAQERRELAKLKALGWADQETRYAPL